MGDFVISKTIKVTAVSFAAVLCWRLGDGGRTPINETGEIKKRPDEGSTSWLASFRNSDGRERAKKMASEKGEYIYTCNRVRTAVLCDNALYRQEDNLVSRSIVDETFDIPLRQQDIWVGVYQEERHLGMGNAETGRPQEPIQTPASYRLIIYMSAKTIPLLSQPRFKASFDATSKPQICNPRFFFRNIMYSLSLFL